MMCHRGNVLVAKGFQCCQMSEVCFLLEAKGVCVCWLGGGVDGVESEGGHDVNYLLMND